MQYCSLQHWTLLSSPDTSTVKHHFLFGPAASFFLELSNCPPLFPSSILDTFQAGGGGRGSFSSVISFYLFILFIRVSWQEYWSGMAFPPPVYHVLPELFAMTCPSWMAPHAMAHSFIELCKALHHDKAVIHEVENK